ncbi:MAG TPA: acetolactate synthase small subunit [Planctomycetota bacterium]|nr:acetolactate synthase small subunit [Planctomycetota bacterium]
MKHIISALVQNESGVLAHISGLFAGRGFNIDSLTVGETEDPAVSRMTIAVQGDEQILEQVVKQLRKVITVLKVQDFSGRDYVERDLMLIKVNAPSGRRGEIVQLVTLFRGRVVDVSATELMIELSGPEKKLEAFIALVRPFGIKELCRTGRVALTRGPR